MSKISKQIRFIVYAGVLAALYVALTYLQDLLLPGSATWAIQCRFSEGLCIFAFFTPAAIPGLSIGCLLFNLSYAGALPLDWILGTLATVVACFGMWLTRNLGFRMGKLRYPVLGMAMPALANGLLVGLELTIYIGGAFWYNGVLVALGELIVLYTVGSVLYLAFAARGLDKRLFA